MKPGRSFHILIGWLSNLGYVIDRGASLEMHRGGHLPYISNAMFSVFGKALDNIRSAGMKHIPNTIVGRISLCGRRYKLQVEANDESLVSAPALQLHPRSVTPLVVTPGFDPSQLSSPSFSTKTG